LLDKEIWHNQESDIALFKKNGNVYQTQFSVKSTSDEAGTGEAIR
jgi:hypothetical protein